MVIILLLSNSMATFLCLMYCDVFYILWCICVLWCILHIFWWVLCIMMCCLYYNKCVIVIHWTSCEWWNVCGTYVWVSKRPAQAHTTHHPLLHFHMLGRCSVPDVLPSTPGVMHVYSRRYTRMTLRVMQGWDLHVPWYHVIYGCVAYDMYVIYMSCASLKCMSCYLFPANSQIYTPPASHSKLIYVVSVGSTTPLAHNILLTSTQLQSSCGLLSVLSLTSLPDHCGCCGLWWPRLGHPYYLI